jgi:hypothetical protein
MEERRFAVLDVGDEHREDIPYFAAMEREMDNGGREALLHHLLNFDLSRVDLRTIPKTGALLEQKIRSMSPEHAWWLDVLQRGKLPARRDDTSVGGKSYNKGDLYDAYIHHANQTGAKRRAIETTIGMFLHKVVPHLRKAQKRFFADGGGNSVQGEGYIFPTLETCRRAFAKQAGQDLNWDDRRYWD